MQPRFVGRLGLADAVTLFNAVIGFIAVIVVFEDIILAARIMLLAAILDGLDGVVARVVGGSPVGSYLDSLADVVSFGMAPAAMIYAVTADLGAGTMTDPWTIAAYVVSGAFLIAVIVRLAMYTAFDANAASTKGVPSTLAATIIGAAVLTGLFTPKIVLGVAGAFCYLMVSTIRYPDLLARDALLMGIVHALAVIFPMALNRSFPVALLTLGLAYMFLSPWLYWRD